MMAKLAAGLTVYSRQRGINPATASRDVLLAVPGVTPEQVDTYIAARSEALANRLPVPPFVSAQGFAVAASPVWRISVRAKSPDGVTFARDAVLRPSNDPQRPFVTLLWQEGMPGPELRACLRDRKIGAGRWNRQTPISGSRCESRRDARPRPPSFDGGRASSRAGARPVAQRGAAPAAAAGAGVRCATSPCSGRRKSPTATSATGRRPASRWARTRRRRRWPDVPRSGRSRRPRAASVPDSRGSSSRCPRARSCARRSPFPWPSRTISRRCWRTTSTGTRRSSPTKCISTRRSSDAMP